MVAASPHAVLVTALFPDHLNWHGGIESYYRDKLSLVAHGPRIVLAPAGDQTLRARLPDRVREPGVLHWVQTAEDESGLLLADPSDLDAADGTVRHQDFEPVWVTKEGEIRCDDVLIMAGDDVPLKGRHNLVNVALAVAMLGRLGIDVRVQAEEIRAALRAFRPLPHRLEAVRSEGGVTWVDDGLSTTPQATIAALKVFDERNVALIVGGADRGIPYEPLADYLAERIHPVLVLTVPDNGPAISEALKELTRHTIAQLSSLEEAVAHAQATLSRPGVVLLSPAAPSFGRYRNYTDRAAHFVQLAQAAGPHPLADTDA